MLSDLLTLQSEYNSHQRVYLSTCVSPSVAQLSETQTLLRNLDNGAEVGPSLEVHGCTPADRMAEGSRYF